MSGIILRPVTEVDFKRFTDAFNYAYSDYFVPIVMTATTFNALIRRDNLSLSGSVAAVLDGKIVGTGLLGIREKRGWIGGLGVTPPYRKQGIGRAMMLYLLREAQVRGLETVHLEVIEKNIPALSLYENLGFEPLRHLLLVERDPQPVHAPLPGGKVIQRSPYELLDYYEAFHTSQNCWQRALPSLRSLSDQIDGWALVQNGHIQAYALGNIDFFNIRLVDFAVDPSAARVEMATGLLSALHRQQPSANGSTYNVAEDDPFWPAFQALDYQVSMRQIEMIYHLT